MAQTTGGADVVVVGAGVIGCSIALRLAQSGADVLVLERGEPGAEASGAAGGILGAQMEAHGLGPMLDFSIAGLLPGQAAVDQCVHGVGFRDADVEPQHHLPALIQPDYQRPCALGLLTDHLLPVFQLVRDGEAGERDRQSATPPGPPRPIRLPRPAREG